MRSPLAEAFVRRLTTGLPVETESFGTLELGAATALSEAIELGQACGVDLSAHHSRCVRDASLDDADLVLGFEEQHAREAVVHAGAPRSKTFTLRHFVRLLDAIPPVTESDPVARALIVVERADAQRTELPARIADDTPDPLGGSWELYRDTAAEIREQSLTLVAALFGVTDPNVLRPPPPKPRRSRLGRLRLGQR